MLLFIYHLILQYPFLVFLLCPLVYNIVMNKYKMNL